MATNHQQVTEGFRILTTVLAPYVATELRGQFSGQWWTQGVLSVLYESQRRDLPASGEDEELTAKLDVARCLLLMDLRWNDLFRLQFSRDHRTWIKELISTRNKWAHSGPVDWTDEDAWRALDTMIRLVGQLDPQATQRIRALARTVRLGTVARSTLVNEARPLQSADDGRRTPIDEQAPHPPQRRGPWHSARGSGHVLPITLTPWPPAAFKKALLRTKRAWITEVHQGDRKEPRVWNAHRITETSNIIGNLRSRPRYRAGEWQRHGIRALEVTIERPQRTSDASRPDLPNATTGIS